MYGAALRGWTSYQEADIGPFEEFVGGAKGSKKPHKADDTEATIAKLAAVDEIIMPDPSGANWEDTLFGMSWDSGLSGGDAEEDAAALSKQNFEAFMEDRDAAEPEEEEDEYEKFVGGLEKALEVVPEVSFDDLL